MSSQKFDLIEFIRSRRNYNLEELKRDRLRYRDLNSPRAQIINTLVRANISKWSDDEIKKNLTSVAHAFTEDEIKKNLTSVAHAFTEAVKRSSLLDSFHVEEYQSKWIQDEVKYRHSLELKKLTHRLPKIKDSLEVDALAEEGEILKSIGEIAESSDSFHRISHLSESSASALNVSGVIGGVIANSLGLFFNLFRCIKEKRMPNDFEKAKITYSAAILICGVCILSGLGGPLAMSIFAASATTLAFSRTIFEIVRDAFRHRTARQKLEKCELERQNILEDLTQLINQCQTEKLNLLKHPPVGNFETFKTNRDKIENKFKTLQALNKKLTKRIYKCQLFAEKQQSKLDKLRKVGVFLGGSVSVIGVILSFTPIAPIGFALIGIGASISLLSDFSARFGKFLQRRRDQRTQSIHPNETNYAAQIDSLVSSNTDKNLSSSLPPVSPQLDTSQLQSTVNRKIPSPDPKPNSNNRPSSDDDDLHPRL